MADEIKPPEPAVHSMDSFTEDDGLNSSLRDVFEKTGAKVDIEKDIDDVPKKSDKPDQKADPEKTDPENKDQDEPDKEKSDEGKEKEDPTRAKGPLPKGAKPKVEPIDKNKAEDLTDPDKIKPPPNLSKSGMEGWNALKESSKKAHAIVAQQRAEITKINLALAEKSKNSSEEVEKIRKEVEELRGYRASFDHQFDPDFKKNYSVPMDKLQTEMKKMLAESGVREDVIKILDWTDSGQMDRVAKSLEEHVNQIASDRFRMRAKDYIELNAKKTEFLEEFRGKHAEFTSKRAQEIENQSMESEAKSLKHVNTLTHMKDEKGDYRFPFLLKFDVEENASDEEKKRVQEHNELAETMRGRLQKIMGAKDPEERAQVSIAAVAASYLNEQNKNLKEEIESLREDLKKYNDASSERRGSKTKVVGGGGGKTPESLELDDALESAFPGRS